MSKVTQLLRGRARISGTFSSLLRVLQQQIYKTRARNPGRQRGKPAARPAWRPDCPARPLRFPLSGSGGGGAPSPGPRPPLCLRVCLSVAPPPGREQSRSAAPLTPEAGPSRPAPLLSPRASREGLRTAPSRGCPLSEPTNVRIYRRAHAPARALTLARTPPSCGGRGARGARGSPPPRSMWLLPSQRHPAG